MVSKVYFLDFRGKIGNVLDKIEELLAASCDAIVNKGDSIAVKLHFGEYGNFRQVRPTFVAQVVSSLKKRGGKPFLTDANSLGGSRADAVNHILTAHRHGFTAAAVDAPILIADGLTGRDYVEVEINGNHFKKACVASAAYYADCIVSLAHFKGNLKEKERYWAATMKNIGIGCAAKPGKAAIHLMSPPKVSTKCTHCLRCLAWCPSDAIKESNSRLTISKDRCSLCGECVAFCPEEAVEMEWVFNETLQEKYVEYAKAVLKGKEGKAGFINFAMDITPICDCAKWSGLPILNDIGILASSDPVAVDQASLDLATERINGDSSIGKWNTQLIYAEKIGLGSRHYELLEI